MDEAYKKIKELKSQGKYAEAIPHAKRYIALAKQEFDENHQHYAAGLNILAGLYVAQDHYAEAEPLNERALTIREKALGREHPDVAESLNNLAGLYGNP